MVLVDTSVWVDHLRRGNSKLRDRLLDDQVVCHPHVIGELACGHLGNRAEVLSLLRALPQTTTITDEEFLYFVERRNLIGAGLGFVDVHLLAAAHLANVDLWSLDRRLRSAAEALGVSAC